VQRYLLTEEESRLKAALWRSQNADYLRKQREKKRRQKQEAKKKPARTQTIITHAS
jgi:hypothetical protein